MYFKIVTPIVTYFTLFLAILSSVGQPVLAQSTNIIGRQPRFKIKEIKIEGNTVFSDSELEAIVAPLEEKEVTPEQIFEVRQQLTNYYLSRGYDNSGAFVPPQNLGDGHITFEIIEGTLVAIEITGLRHLSEKFIKARLPQPGEPLNRIELVKYLIKLKKNSLIKTLSAEIQNQSVGQNILLLNIEETPPLTASFTLTDGYSPSIGRHGGNARAGYRNLLGSGDELNVNGSLTDGLWRIGLWYAFLLNKYDGKITLEYNNADVENTESEIKALGIKADYENFQVDFSQPIIFTPSDKLTVGLGVELIRSETFILGNRSFSFVRGLPDGQSRITNLQIFQEYVKEGASTFFAINSQFNVGVDLFDATRSEEVGIDGIAWFWQGQAQHFKRLGKNTILFNRVGIQLTTSQLLPIQQATLGGISTVQGYRTNLTLGDNIFFGNTEVRFILAESQKLGSITIIPFFNWGSVWNNKRETVGSNTLVSVGLGLRYMFKDALEFRVNYAIPLVDATGFGPTDTEQNFSFYVLTHLLNF